MPELLAYCGGLFLGWSVGANDAANMFGTAVGSRMVRFTTAAVLIAVFVTLGAVCQGYAGVQTVHGLAGTELKAATVCALAAGVAMTLMSVLRMPISSSQMLIAAVIGVGLWRGSVDWRPVVKVLACWIISPLGAMLIAAGLYRALARLLQWWRPSIFVLDPVLRGGLIVCGCYGAYALGANGVGIVCAVYVGPAPLANPWWGALLGGLSIGVGALTYSRPVMMTIGRGMVPLDAFGALVAVLALALTVHAFALLGVPVSTSQAIVGALLGLGLAKGLHIVNLEMLWRVIGWWLASPLIAAATAMALYTLWP